MELEELEYGDQCFMCLGRLVVAFFLPETNGWEQLLPSILASKLKLQLRLVFMEFVLVQGKQLRVQLHMAKLKNMFFKFSLSLTNKNFTEGRKILFPLLTWTYRQKGLAFHPQTPRDLPSKPPRFGMLQKDSGNLALASWRWKSPTRIL